MHPLLALLSVLGGVAALGPIGIFIGPIAVAFLQAALTMLQTELVTFSVAEKPAEIPVEAGVIDSGVASKDAASVKS